MDMDGALWRFLSKVTDYIILNILFIIFCLPVLSIGTSKAALIDLVNQRKKDEEGPLVKSFIRSFKENFIASTKLWVMFLAAILVVSMNVYVLTLIQIGWMTALYMAATTSVFYFVNSMYLNALIVNLRFRDSLKSSIYKGWMLAIMKLPYVLLTITVWYLPIVLIFFFTHYALYVITFYSLIGYSITALIFNQLHEKILQ